MGMPETLFNTTEAQALTGNGFASFQCNRSWLNRFASAQR